MIRSEIPQHFSLITESSTDMEVSQAANQIITVLLERFPTLKYKLDLIQAIESIQSDQHARALTHLDDFILRDNSSQKCLTTVESLVVYSLVSLIKKRAHSHTESCN